MSAITLHREVSEFVELLAERDHLLSPNSHKIVELAQNRRLVTWNSVKSEWSPAHHSESGLPEYFDILRGREFSALLLDGSIIQISYLYDGPNILRHRATYLPCPLHFDPDELRTADGDFLPLEDFLVILDEDDLRSRVRTRPAFRFEYDPEHAAEGHPSSHLHLGKSHCRIPVKAPLKLRQFSRFILKNFYPEIFGSMVGWLGAHPQPFDATILEAERSEFHIAF